MTVLRVAFGLAVIAAITVTVAKQWPEVRTYLHSLAWSSVLLSLVMVLLGLGAAVMAYRASCAAVGHSVSTRSAGQIYLIGMLAKYLPGSVWAFLLQMELGKRAKLPRSRSFMASLIMVGVGVTVSLLFGLFGLPALDRVGRGVAITLVVMIPISLVCAHPAVLTRLLGLVAKLIRRPPLEQPLTWKSVGAVGFWSALSFLANGAHLWLLAGAGSTAGLMGLMRCVGAIGLGLTVGLFIFLVPSGAGVRELILVATLLPYVPNEGVAIAMAVTSRLIFVLADLIAGIAAISSIDELRHKARALVRRVIPAGRQAVPAQPGSAAGSAGE